MPFEIVLYANTLTCITYEWFFSGMIIVEQISFHDNAIQARSDDSSSDFLTQPW